MNDSVGQDPLPTGSTVEPQDEQWEDYEYDISESLVSFDWAELVPTVVVYSIVLLLGIFGNVLIIITIARFRRLKTITNIFLASLSSADLLLVTICVPVNVAKLFSYTWTFGVFLCKFVHYMQNVSAICSVLTLTAMSIERYYAIVHPIRAQYLCTLSQARKVIVGIWFASFFLASPTLWIQIHMAVGERVPAYWCVRDWDNPLNWRIYELYMLVLVLLLPLSIMAGAYISIAKEIWRVTYLRSAMTNDNAVEPSCPPTEMPASELNNSGSNPGRQDATVPPSSSASSSRRQADHRTARQVIKMLIAIVVLFVVCWTPHLIDNVLMSFDLLPGVRTGPMKHMRIAFHLLSYINSCCNPVVYGFMSRNFRRGFQSALGLRNGRGCWKICCCCCSPSRKERQHSVYKFSPSSSRCSRIVTQIRLHDPGYVRCSIGGAMATNVSVMTNPDSVM